MQNYWNRRFATYGHTNLRISALLAYDQKIRFKALKKLLLRNKVLMADRPIILDIGCGTGNLVAELTQYKPRIVGFDLSNYLLKKTKQRFEIAQNVQLFCGDVKAISLLKNSFDLVTSMMVLQHITPDKQLSTAMQNLFDVLKPEGYALLFESVFSDKDKSDQDQNFYLNKKTSAEWRALIRETGFILVAEESYPQFAFTFFRIFKQLFASIRSKSTASQFVAENLQDSTSIYANIIKIILILFTPIDFWLFTPFPKKYSRRRFFLLQKKKICP